MGFFAQGRRMGLTALAILGMTAAIGSASGAASSDRPQNRERPATALPVALVQSQPEYPAVAVVQGLAGEVVVEFIVDKEGEVKGAQVVHSSNPVFDAAALAAVACWVFEPGRKDGRNVATRMRVPVVFTPAPELIAALKSGVQAIGPANPRPLMLPDGVAPVYPYDALMNDRRAELWGEVDFDAHGQAGPPVWTVPPPPEFAEAVEAMLDTCSEDTAGRPAITGKRRLHLTFNPYDGLVRISDAAAAILKRLRTEGEKAGFADPDKLDAKLQPLSEPRPAFPRRLRGKVARGQAVIGCFVDEAGQAELPHVLSATDPAFGYAACQAIAMWRFTPPRRDGQPVVVRAEIPVEFNLK
ncbi:MAG: TonB family protein [Opitutales bacterium]